MFSLYGAVMYAAMALTLGVKLYALVDAAVRPQWAYKAAGIAWSKPVWLVVLGLAVLLTGLGMLGIIAIVAAVFYLVDVRPKVRALGRRGGSSSAGPYGPW